LPRRHPCAVYATKVTVHAHVSARRRRPHRHNRGDQKDRESRAARCDVLAQGRTSRVTARRGSRPLRGNAMKSALNRA